MVCIVNIETTSGASRHVPTEPKQNECAISVIMPVYNTEAYLAECMDSILDQAFRDVELICVDDESTDGSLALLREYESRDERVKVFAIPHGGQSVARNRAIREARGKYVYFMDSDDRLEAGALGKMYALIEERDVDVLYFDGSTFYDSEALAALYPRYKDSYKRRVAYREVVSGVELFVRMTADDAYWVQPCLQIMKRDYLRAINLTFYEGIIYEDNISSLECMLQAGRVSHENVALFQRRIREQSTVTGVKTYRNFYGYFICWVMMTAFARTNKLPPRAMKELDKRISAIRLNAIEIGGAIPMDELHENMRRERPLLRLIYFCVFRMPIVRRGRKLAGIPKSFLHKCAYRLIFGPASAIGRMLAVWFGRRRRKGG